VEFPNKPNDTEILIKKIGAQRVLAQMIDSITKLDTKEPYILSLKLDLQVTLNNYKSRYDKMKDSRLNQRMESRAKKRQKRCLHKKTVQLDASGPHYAKLVCADCGKFIRWVGHPRGCLQRKQITSRETCDL